MKVVHSLIGLVALIFAHPVAWPQSDQECNYSGKQSQMNACAIRDFETADRKLNRIYKENEKEKTKQVRFLQSRGFSSDTVFRVLCNEAGAE